MYQDSESRKTVNLRHSKKYYYPQSPLTCIKWWRICLDEGQAIENVSNKISEMTSCLKSVHRWAMTGTPVQKSLKGMIEEFIFSNLKYYD